MDFLTLAGYVVAALAMALGLYLILRKNVADEPTEDDGMPATAALQDTAAQGHSRNIPVVPRHAREQLQATAATPNTASSRTAPITPTHSNSPTSNTPTQSVADEDEDLLAQMPQMTADRHERDIEDEFNQKTAQPAVQGIGQSTAQRIDQIDQQDLDHLISTPRNSTPSVTASPVSKTVSEATDADENSIMMQQAQQLAESSKPDQDTRPDPFDQALAQLEAATTPDSADTPSSAAPLSRSGRTVETAVVEEWEGESALLDAHIEDQERRDDESALAQAEHIMALYVMPNPSRALSGERTMHLLRQFGLRYGEMSLFHRFEDSDGTGPLMFSVLRYTSEGPSGFDLETLPTEQVEGLAFFLALPSKHAVAGYDTMVSISTLLAREIHGQVFDEHMNQLSPQLRDHYRHFVLEYRKPS